jgi:hypothetical protein
VNTGQLIAGYGYWAVFLLLPSTVIGWKTPVIAYYAAH